MRWGDYPASVAMPRLVKTSGTGLDPVPLPACLPLAHGRGIHPDLEGYLNVLGAEVACYRVHSPPAPRAGARVPDSVCWPDSGANGGSQASRNHHGRVGHHRP